LNGLELRERIRKRGSSIPIVFITGDAGLPTGGQEAAHLEAPALAKPFDDSELIAAIARAMSAIDESTE
jgi:FixJ family two-component response regulator